MKKKLLLIMSLIVLVPCNVKAASNNVRFSCNNGKPGDTVDCTILIDEATNIGGFRATQKVDSGLEIVKVLNPSGSEVDFYKKISINSLSINGSGKIGTLKVKISDNISAGTRKKIELTDIEVSDNSDNNNPKTLNPNPVSAFIQVTAPDPTPTEKTFTAKFK